MAICNRQLFSIYFPKITPTAHLFVNLHSPFMCLICADETSEANLRIAEQKMQQKCMYGLFGVEEAHFMRPVIIRSYGVIKEQSPEDVCGWYGVACIDGIVRMLKFGADNWSKLVSLE